MNCLATIGVCVFGALTSVGALFYFKEENFMKKFLKRTSALIVALIMVLSAAMLPNFAGNDWFSIEAEAAEYALGDIIEFGSYPQSKVTDTATLNALNSKSLSWQSYGYYIGTGAHGTMTQSDYMKYADTTYNGTKYRAVKFTQYRPYQTYESSYCTWQDQNGYHTNTTYWFEFEPIYWRVLDPNNGLIMCENIIDSQAYSNTVYDYGTDPYGLTACWNDSSHTNYANDYATSSIREWLNDDFYNTAFTSTQKTKIKTTTLDNSASTLSEFDSETTYDKVFLLSWDEMKTPNYGFESSGDTDISRGAAGSDYAKCQGLYVYTGSHFTGVGNSYWFLRTPGYNSNSVGEVGSDGFVNYYGYVCETSYGIRPAMKISGFSSDNIGEKTVISISVTAQPSVNRYKYGIENLDTSGLVITATYSDGSTAVVDNSAVEFTGFDTSTRGVKTITATYEGCTATFDIEVYFTFGQWLLYIICFGWIWM